MTIHPTPVPIPNLPNDEFAKVPKEAGLYLSYLRGILSLTWSLGELVWGIGRNVKGKAVNWQTGIMQTDMVSFEISG